MRPALLSHRCFSPCLTRRLSFFPSETAGQSCIVGSRILVQDTVYDEFLRLYIAAVKEIKVGKSGDDFYGALISKIQFDKVRCISCSVTCQLKADLDDVLVRSLATSRPARRRPNSRREEPAKETRATSSSRPSSAVSPTIWSSAESESSSTFLASGGSEMTSFPALPSLPFNQGDLRTCFVCHQVLD